MWWCRVGGWTRRRQRAHVLEQRLPEHRSNSPLPASTCPQHMLPSTHRLLEQLVEAGVDDGSRHHPRAEQSTHKANRRHLGLPGLPHACGCSAQAGARAARWGHAHGPSGGARCALAPPLPCTHLAAASCRTPSRSASAAGGAAGAHCRRGRLRGWVYREGAAKVGRLGGLGSNACAAPTSSHDSLSTMAVRRAATASALPAEAQAAVYSCRMQGRGVGDGKALGGAAWQLGGGTSEWTRERYHLGGHAIGVARRTEIQAGQHSRSSQGVLDLQALRHRARHCHGALLARSDRRRRGACGAGTVAAERRGVGRRCHGGKWPAGSGDRSQTTSSVSAGRGSVNEIAGARGAALPGEGASVARPASHPRAPGSLGRLTGRGELAGACSAGL